MGYLGIKKEGSGKGVCLEGDEQMADQVSEVGIK